MKVQLFNIVKLLGSKIDGLATVRSTPRLFDIVKLLGSKPDGRATVRSPTALLQIGYTVKAFVGTQFKDRQPCYCML